MKLEKLTSLNVEITATNGTFAYQVSCDQFGDTEAQLITWASTDTRYYLATRNGHIIRVIENGKNVTVNELVGTPNTDGYRVVHLTDVRTGKRVRTLRSRLVWQTFNHTLPSAGYEIDHIDANKTHDDLSNLQVLSHADNCRKSAAYAKARKARFKQEGYTGKYIGVFYKPGTNEVAVACSHAAGMADAFGMDRRTLLRARNRIYETGAAFATTNYHRNHNGEKLLVIPAATAQNVTALDLAEAGVCNGAPTLEDRIESLENAIAAIHGMGKEATETKNN